VKQTINLTGFLLGVAPLETGRSLLILSVRDHRPSVCQSERGERRFRIQKIRDSTENTTEKNSMFKKMSKMGVNPEYRELLEERLATEKPKGRVQRRKRKVPLAYQEGKENISKET